MVKRAGDIHNSQIEYELLEQNSNSVVASVLKSVGVDVTSVLPEGRNIENFPAIENTLGDSIAPTTKPEVPAGDIEILDDAFTPSSGLHNNIVAGEFSGMTRAQRIALEPIKDFDTLINTTAADFGRMIFRQGGGRGGNIFNPINTDAFASQVGTILGRNLAGFAAGSAGELLSNALGGGTKTRVTERESARSQEAEENFRESRGQVQKRLARELVRGRRYS
jgi:hypothetical protein